MLYYFIALLIIMMDQLSKWVIIKNITEGDSIPIISNFLYITSLRNPGAAFGILKGQLTFFIIAAVITIAVLLYLLATRPKEAKWYALSLSLLLGGAIGNLIDRLFRGGEVVDFIDVYIFSYNYPAFNIADISLNVGVVLMLIYVIKEERKHKKT